MFLKKLAGVGAMVIGVTVAAPAYADLTIVNNTDYDSTCIVNDGACSTILGDIGITHAHSTNSLDYVLLRIACGLHPDNCHADVYMSNDCSGPKVGTVVMNINDGISSIEETGAFTLALDNPFEIQISSKG